MAKYIAKRVALALVTLVIVSMLTFFLMFLVPGGPFLSEKSPSPAVLAAMEEKYGLDKPVIVQYKNYMLNLLQGELGPSIKQRGRTVAQIIGSRFPVSARIGGIALAIAVVVGVVLGSVAALNRGKWIDNVIIVIATCGIAVPSFVICTLLLMLFGLKLGWLPTLGLKTWKHYIMPALALAFNPMCYIARLMRSSMLDVLRQDYIKTGRAKGLSEKMVLFKHAMRNAILPVITYLGPLTAGILTGGFVIEKIFTIPGMGKFFVESINNRDYPLIMGVTVFYSALLVLMNLVVDLLYGIIDPRIKYE